jgi:hypothetical protein
MSVKLAQRQELSSGGFQGMGYQGHTMAEVDYYEDDSNSSEEELDVSNDNSSDIGRKFSDPSSSSKAKYKKHICTEECKTGKRVCGFSRWKYKQGEEGREEKKTKKIETNAVKKVKERQRRSKMTESISELRRLVPQCQDHKKLNQSLVMSLAVDYILALQERLQELEDENRQLRASRGPGEAPLVPPARDHLKGAPSYEPKHVPAHEVSYPVRANANHVPAVNHVTPAAPQQQMPVMHHGHENTANHVTPVYPSYALRPNMQTAHTNANAYYQNYAQEMDLLAMSDIEDVGSWPLYHHEPPSHEYHPSSAQALLFEDTQTPGPYLTLDLTPAPSRRGVEQVKDESTHYV